VAVVGIALAFTFQYALRREAVRDSQHGLVVRPGLVFNTPFGVKWFGTFGNLMFPSYGAGFQYALWREVVRDPTR
jgi:hypothetical protein